ncbi:MAG: sigma-E factor negative regulatory protein [Wenzhouxiangella sp.]|jgi:negative regulator of sigma E activity|nr:sigma-E factor negative regulatory protein [Wenzhouxiangella sp.]
MTESNREHLSCLMDGELDRKAQQFLLRRLSTDPELSARWQRYHLVRSCLHQEMGQGIAIVERVAQAVAVEADPPVSRALPAWLRPVAGGAIAACVAVVAIIGINQNLTRQGALEPTAGQPGFVSQSTPLDRSFSRQAVPVNYSEVSPADRQRINTYVLRHHQAVGGSGLTAFIPIVTGTPTSDAAAADFEGEQAEQTQELVAEP